MLPSDFWKTAVEQEADWTGWSGMPFDAIEQLCTSLRTPNVPCEANRLKYARGMFFVAIEVVFDDGAVWVARLCLGPRGGRVYSRKTVARRISCEVATLRLVAERTTIPVPTVYAWSESVKNNLRFPYIISSAILGRTAVEFNVPTLENFDVIPEQQREAFARFCKSLARVQLELSRVTLDKLGSVYFDPDDQNKYVVGPYAFSGRGPYATAAEYEAAERGHVRMLGLLKRHVSMPADHRKAAFALWLHFQLLSAVARADEGSTTFMLSHGDLKYANIMIDENSEVIGIIDWDLSCSVLKHHFATQLRDHVQMVWSAATRPGLHYTVYRDALVSAEREQNTQRTESIAELYAAPMAQMLAFASKFIWQESCTDDKWADAYSRALGGATDWAAERNGEAFRAWCDALEPSLCVVEPGAAGPLEP
ncbi:hypothetical protein BKA62DRAFT_726604 [Auriculariales sp. MPI-PUGE-AT-0066]|nr:hypothetical protein BKA62DRAFT_726604 [Auriculariales sp. MPI-PUGE-AT-0066]